MNQSHALFDCILLFKLLQVIYYAWCILVTASAVLFHVSILLGNALNSSVFSPL